MAENEPDGAEDLVRGFLRTALAVGGRLGEMLARQRAERHGEILRMAEEERRRLEERFDAERTVMRIELAPVHHQQYWETATPEDVGVRYGQARQWEEFDPFARASRERVEEEIKNRYDLSPEEFLSGTPGTEHGQDAGQGLGMHRAAEADLAEAERQSAAVARGDLRNDVDTQNAAAAAEELWDSGARRQEMAEELMGRFGATSDGRDGAEAVLAADRDNGTHPRTAVQETSRTEKRRKSWGRGQGKTSELGRG